MIDSEPDPSKQLQRLRDFLEENDKEQAAEDISHLSPAEIKQLAAIGRSCFERVKMSHDFLQPDNFGSLWWNRETGQVAIVYKVEIIDEVKYVFYTLDTVGSPPYRDRCSRFTRLFSIEEPAALAV